MRSIANQDDPATVPPIELDPLDWSDVELCITFQGGEIRRNGPTESCKAVPEALQTSREWVIEAPCIDCSKAIGVAVTHLDDPEETSLEAVMNLLRNGLRMRKTGDRR
jgi:hypothetical protein